MAARVACELCVSFGTASCRNNETCVCKDGFLGSTCQDRVTTASTPIINIGAIVAGVFGGILFTVIVGLIVFCIWKKRSKKKFLTLSASNSTTTSEPIVVPALYDLSMSRRDSNVTSAPTVTYHIYDELP